MLFSCFWSYKSLKNDQATRKPLSAGCACKHCGCLLNTDYISQVEIDRTQTRNRKLTLCGLAAVSTQHAHRITTSHYQFPVTNFPSIYSREAICSQIDNRDSIYCVTSRRLTRARSVFRVPGVATQAKNDADRVVTPLCRGKK